VSLLCLSCVSHLLLLGPTNKLPTSAAVPPVKCTTQLPAKSRNPISLRKPVSDQHQDTRELYTRLLRIKLMNMYTSTRILSATPPLIMVVVVVANVRECMKLAEFLNNTPPSWRKLWVSPRTPTTTIQSLQS